jgi:ribosomal protein S18 acetylase RimI-like enzyme
VRVPLAFESDILGIPTARLDLGDATGHADALNSALQREVASFQDDGLMLVSCRIPSTSPATGVLEANGFRQIEELVQLRQDLPSEHRTPDVVRFAETRDRDVCVSLSSAAFSFDRFHADPLIANKGADDLKARWVANAFDGRADKIFVADQGGGADGFLLCMRRDGTAVIDLIAVAEGEQGKGLGKALACAGLAHYSDAGAEAMIVGTQATNLSSLAMYQALGFVEENRFYTYHWVRQGA